MLESKGGAEMKPLPVYEESSHVLIRNNEHAQEEPEEQVPGKDWTCIFTSEVVKN